MKVDIVRVASPLRAGARRVPRDRGGLFAAGVTATTAAAVLLLASCRPEIVVRLTTRVFPDGGIQRRVELVGREADGSVPKSPTWLEDEARVQLADRAAWGKVEEGPGTIAADGFFASGERVPGTLAHRTESGTVSDRVKVSLTGEDLVVLKRWAYRESWTDPYGPDEAARAIDRLIDLACRILGEEVHRELGRDLDTKKAEALLRTEGRATLLEILSVRARAPGKAGLAERNRSWAEALRRRGVTAAGYGEERFWNDQAGTLLAWTRRRIAEALSTSERPVTPSELTFWPDAQDKPDALEGMVGRALAPGETIDSVVEPLIETLAGYYGGGGGPRFRFELRLVLPGRLLRTNGTPDGDGAVWLVRDEDLTSQEKVLEAESVVLNDEKLRGLEARRDLEPIRLVQLCDLLTTRDSTGALKELLANAVERGSLSVLRDGQAVPQDLQPLARELAALLDPATPAPSP